MRCPNCGNDNLDDSRFCGRCGKSLVETPTTPPTATTQHISPRASLDFMPGQHFGPRYQIVEEIGRGGMGVVYKAIDRELDRVVALKMIRPELSSDPGMVDQFKRELILAREISHENVIRIHDLGEARGIKYISMKYIEGTSLKDLIQATGRLTLEKAIGITKQVCAALTAAHKKGVIHRDLKPQNIMIDRSGDAHVMDFGIARSLAVRETVSEGRILGTPNYMSPEQAQGKGGDVRSDIYSLGCILYEMTTGRRPFKADTVEGLIHHHLRESPKPPSRLNPAISGPLEAVILRAMAKDPAKRFSSADELCNALRRISEEVNAPAKASDIEGTRAPARRETSIAVLPFRDMSPEKDQEYFCDGMAEEIINALVRIEGLRVAALTSAFQFKNKDLDIRTVGEQLNVGAVLEGSVRKAGKRLRVTAQLVNVSDGYHVWSDRYDRDLEDVFAIQDDIAEAIVKALRPRLVGKKSRPAVQRVTNLEAYNLYLKGRYHWNTRNPADITKAIEYFNRALELDPDYALAHAGLADCFIMLYYTRPKEIYAKASAAAARALELDATLAEPHTTLGWIACNRDYDWERAEREFRTSLELNPSYATGHQWYALFLAAMGRFDEAFEEIEVAKQVDPLSLIIKVASAWISSCARRFDHALEEARTALDMDPDFYPGHSVLGRIYFAQGMLKEALAETGIMLNILGTGIGDALERAYAESGPEKALRMLIDHMSSDEFPYPSVNAEKAALLVWLGDHDDAIRHLEQAYANREQETLFMTAVIPDFDPLRSDPRFQDLLRRLNHPLAAGR